MPPIDLVLSRLPSARPTGERSWEACCPVHDDPTPSMSVGIGDDGRVLLHCFGCPAKAADIVGALGLDMRDIHPDQPKARAGGGLPDEWPTEEILDWPQCRGMYVYQNEDGSPRYCVIRYVNHKGEKSFVQYRSVGADRWRKGLKESTAGGQSVRVEPVLYRLPRVVEAAKTGRTIWLPEGEKDVETLERWGLTAACNPEGAGKWKPAFARAFAGATVYLLPDNDEHGRSHALAVANSLHGKAREVRIIELPDLPPKGDVTDWATAGGTDQDLFRIAAAAPPWTPSNGKALAAPGGNPNLTDYGNAIRLVARHGKDLRHCHPWRKWMAWDGRRWAEDDTAEIARRAKDVARAIPDEAKGLDGKEFRDVLKWALQSESSERISAMIRLAASEPGVPALPEEFDPDDWTLNVQNGILDLRTGQLGPHERAAMNTKICPVAYVQDAKCPTWDAFLSGVMEDRQEMVSFLRRCAGYSLTGDTSEHCLFFLHGNGRNGKSTFLEVMRMVAGDYSQQTEFSTWTERKSDTIRNDLADLKSARFVTTMEAQQGRKLDEGVIKAATGGDVVKARKLFAEYFQFSPRFKLWMAANCKPIIRGADKGIWSRIHLLPFEVTIRAEDRDKKLRERLGKELPGILAWAVRGCMEWQDRGLAVPTIVEAATEEYREEMDVLADFLQERCVLHHSLRTMSGTLMREYKKFLAEEEDEKASSRLLGLRLRERGLKRERNRHEGNRWQWIGIGVLDQLTQVELAMIDLERSREAAAAQAGGNGSAAQADPGGAGSADAVHRHGAEHGEGRMAF